MRSRFFVSASLILFLACTHTGAVVYVSQTGDNTTGTSWSTAFTSLQAAIDYAAGPPAEAVWVGQGNYVLTSSLTVAAGVALYGGFPASGGEMQDRNPALYSTTLDGDGSLYPVVSIDTVDNVRLDGFGVTGAYGAGPDNNGAGVLCDDSSGVVIENCKVYGNQSPGSPSSGAGIMCMYSDVVIQNCDISGNAVSNNSGGISGYYATIDISSTSVSNNTYGESGGGCGFWYCTVSVVDCEISNNTGGFNGGGVFCHNCSAATFERTRITGNSASFIGGGITTYDTPLIMTSCTVSGNTAYKGGGVEVHGSSSGSVSLRGCLIAENAASDIGGGVFTGLAGLPMTLSYCTIAGNTAGSQGGGVFVNDSSTTISDTILAGNTKLAVYEGDAAYDAVVTRCLFFNNLDGCYYDIDTGTAYFDVTGPAGLDENVAEVTGNLQTDPCFVDPVTGDYHLGYTSPCIDAAFAVAPSVDVDGNTRPFDVPYHAGEGPNSYDTGCYELVLDPSDDTDGDGVNNLLESIAGTDPLDDTQWPEVPAAGLVGLVAAVVAIGLLSLSRLRRTGR